MDWLILFVWQAQHVSSGVNSVFFCSSPQNFDSAQTHLLLEIYLAFKNFSSALILTQTLLCFCLQFVFFTILLHCAVLCKFPCKACLQTQRNVLFKASYEYSRPPESFGSDGAFSFFHSFTPVLFLLPFTKTRKWSVIIQFINPSGVLLYLIVWVLLYAQSEWEKQWELLQYAWKEHTTTGKKEDVTKPMEARKWSEWEMATSSRWWKAYENDTCLSNQWNTQSLVSVVSCILSPFLAEEQTLCSSYSCQMWKSQGFWCSHQGPMSTKSHEQSISYTLCSLV